MFKFGTYLKRPNVYLSVVLVKVPNISLFFSKLAFDLDPSPIHELNFGDVYFSERAFYYLSNDV